MVLRAACHLNTNLGAKPKSRATEADFIYKCASCHYMSRVHFLCAIFFFAGSVCQWWSQSESYCIGPIPLLLWPIMVALTFTMAMSGLFSPA